MKHIATVINNNQPGWENIVETEPHVTLDIGTKLYLQPPDSKDLLELFICDLIDNHEGAVITEEYLHARYADLLVKQGLAVRK